MAVDVLIITALQDELNSVLDYKSDVSSDGWIKAKDSSEFEYHTNTFTRSDGTFFTVAAAGPVEMGETAVVNLATRLIKDLSPFCLAMCGVCAGNKEKVYYGDVIIADRVFQAKRGKMVYSDNGSPEFENDNLTYNLDSKWLQAAQTSSNKWTNPFIATRPVSYESQENWLRAILYEEQKQGADVFDKPDRVTKCPNYESVVERLERCGDINIEGEKMILTQSGQQKVQELKIRKGTTKPQEQAFQVHIGPLATYPYVVTDPKEFEALRQYQRRILGLEMEGAAIGAVAAAEDVPKHIVVKAVQDYCHPKNDLFRSFAAGISARFTLDFLRDNLPVRPSGPSSLKSGQMSHVSYLSKSNVPIKVIEINTASESDIVWHGDIPVGNVAESWGNDQNLRIKYAFPLLKYPEVSKALLRLAIHGRGLKLYVKEPDRWMNESREMIGNCLGTSTECTSPSSSADPDSGSSQLLPLSSFEVVAPQDNTQTFSPADFAHQVHNALDLELLSQLSELVSRVLQKKEDGILRWHVDDEVADSMLQVWHEWEEQLSANNNLLHHFFETMLTTAEPIDLPMAQGRLGPETLKACILRATIFGLAVQAALPIKCMPFEGDPHENLLVSDSRGHLVGLDTVNTDKRKSVELNSVAHMIHWMADYVLLANCAAPADSIRSLQSTIADSSSPRIQTSSRKLRTQYFLTGDTVFQAALSKGRESLRNYFGKEVVHLFKAQKTLLDNINPVIQNTGSGGPQYGSCSGIV